MKKRIGLLLLCALLSGCSSNNSPEKEDPNANVIRTTFLLNYSFTEMSKSETLELSPLTYVTQSSFTWVSSDPLVATVDNGVVTPVGYGSVVISVYDETSIGTCSILVKEKENVVDFKLSTSNIVLNVGDTNSVEPIITKNGKKVSNNDVVVTLKEESVSEVASFAKDFEYYVFTGKNSGTAVYSFTVNVDNAYYGANLLVKVN